MNNLEKQFGELPLEKQFAFNRMLSQYKEMSDEQKKEFFVTLLMHHFVTEVYYQQMLKNCLLD